MCLIGSTKPTARSDFHNVNIYDSICWFALKGFRTVYTALFRKSLVILLLQISQIFFKVPR